MTDSEKELVKRLRALVIMDEVGSDNPLGREAANAIERLSAQVERLMNSWRCFHCGENFTTEDAARDHFGGLPNTEAACRIKGGDERRLVAALRKEEAHSREMWKRKEAAEAQVVALTKERDEAKKDQMHASSEWYKTIQRAEAAEAEVASLSMQLDGARGVLKETEARAVKLHRALQSAIDMLEPVGHNDDTPEQAKIDWKNDLISLRKVLEATQ